MESVAIRTSSPDCGDVGLMFGDSEYTDGDLMSSDSGRNTTDPTASSEQEENIPTEKKRKKKKGICAFLRRMGKAVKLATLGCSEVDIVSTYPSCDPTDVQQDLSGFDWASSVDPCPSGVELPVNADPYDPERCESVLELLSVSDVSSLHLPVNADPDDPERCESVLELLSVSDVSSLHLPVNADPDDPEPSCSSVLEPESAPDLELRSFSGLSSHSSIELSCVVFILCA